MKATFLISVCLFFSGCLSWNAPLISTDKTHYLKDEPIRVTIENNSGEAIFFGGCNDFIVEKENNGGWVIAVQKLCVWEGIPTMLPPGRKKIYEMRLEEGVYRIRFEYGIGCSTGRNLSQAGCTEFKIIYVEFGVGIWDIPSRS